MVELLNPGFEAIPGFDTNRLITQFDEAQADILRDMSFLSRLACITDDLYLSGASAVNIDTLVQHNIKCVINATVDIPSINVPDVTTLKIAIDDNPSAEIAPHFEKCIEQIEETRRQGGCTLVHCIAGVSRSASICIAYLMKTRRYTLRQAYDHVKEKRPVIHPNVGFFRQLIAYEEQLFGTTTVKMVPSPIGTVPDVYEEQTRNMIPLSSPKQNVAGKKKGFKAIFDKLT